MVSSQKFSLPCAGNRPMHVEKPVTTDVCFKTEAAVIVFLVCPSSSSGQKTQEKEKPLQIRERQSGDGIGSVKSDYMKATDGLQKKKKMHTTLISHHLWRFLIVCPWRLLGCFYSTERRESNCGCCCVLIVDFLVHDPLLPGFPLLDL